MSMSIGTYSQFNNYYKPQRMDNATTQNTPQSINAANTSIAVGKTENKTQSSEISDKKDPNYVCQTCKQRRYQDKSSDPGVSFKSPGYISPGASASVVMSHEQEHVSNEKEQASSEERRVVSQSVVLHYSVCPECHKPYVSGGQTTTVTASDNKKNNQNKLDIRV